MIHKKSREEVKLMKIAGDIVARVHKEMKNVIKPGVTTYELDKIAYEIIHDHKSIPTFLGYNGFPATICASVNEQVVHGIPSKDTVLKEGDVVSIDVGATYRGLVADGAWTYPVGEIDKNVQNLLNVCEASLFAGIKKMVEGNILDDVSGAVEDVVMSNNMGLVREYGGHGVGRVMHEDPFLFNYKVGCKTVLKNGMTIAIEPMVNLGCDEVQVLDDGWTVITKDKKPSAHFEHTVLIDGTTPQIITKLLD